jgi:hypothetical protein
MKLKLGNQISAHFELEPLEYVFGEWQSPRNRKTFVTIRCKYIDMPSGYVIYNRFKNMVINPDQLEFTFCNNVKEHKFKAVLHSRKSIGKGDRDICAKFGLVGLVGMLSFKPDSIILPF